MRNLLTKEVVNDYWHVFEAIRQGKDVQLFNEDNVWVDIEDNPRLSLHYPPHRYRVKPEPVRTTSYVNVYGDGSFGSGQRSVKDCDFAASSGRIAVLKVTIEDGVAVSSEILGVK